MLREETEIIEGEVVEVQIDRPASGTVNAQLYVFNMCSLMYVCLNFLLILSV